MNGRDEKKLRERIEAMGKSSFRLQGISVESCGHMEIDIWQLEAFYKDAEWIIPELLGELDRLRATVKSVAQLLDALKKEGL